MPTLATQEKPLPTLSQIWRVCACPGAGRRPWRVDLLPWWSYL
ncbi:MAG TPA: hypothetical protein VGF67_07065 [Ktedonobacteraceae bacterium]